MTTKSKIKHTIILVLVILIIQIVIFYLKSNIFSYTKNGLGFILLGYIFLFVYLFVCTLLSVFINRFVINFIIVLITSILNFYLLFLVNFLGYDLLIFSFIMYMGLYSIFHKNTIKVLFKKKIADEENAKNHTD